MGYNNYLIYNPDTNVIVIKKECNEIVGRTCSKQVLIEEKNNALFLFGTTNGMEHNSSIISYDFIKDKFNRVHIQQLPEEILEPIVVYSIKNKKIYIISGLISANRKISDIIWILDINKIPEENWG